MMSVAVVRRRVITEETTVVANVGGGGGAPVLVIPVPRVKVPYEMMTSLSSHPKTLHVLWH